MAETPTLPGPWAPDEAPGPTCHLGAREEASCSLLPAAGACDAHRALVAERDALCAECERLRERVQNEEQVQAGMTDQALDLAAENNRLHISLGRLLRAAQSLHRAWRRERQGLDSYRLRAIGDCLLDSGLKGRAKFIDAVPVVSRVVALVVERNRLLLACQSLHRAWRRDSGEAVRAALRLCEELRVARGEAASAVRQADSAEDALKSAQADNARLRAELAALVQVAEKLRQDLDRLSGQALDLGRDSGRIHRALDEAGVPMANPEPGKPWRIDDRVQWALERLKTTGGLVDRLEGQLAETGAELADVKHQLARLQLSACRLVAVNGGRA
jgi:hypothetical protein